MPKFDPKTAYDIVPDNFNIKDFHEYAEEFVVRPPYQRKNVWSRKKRQDLLDSLFRRYYVPRIVLREVRLDDDRTVNEVIDGQQRIDTVQRFYANDLPLPRSLQDLNPELPGKRYAELPSDVRRFVDRLAYQADVVKGIGDPKNPAHQNVATTIFWRLQQGESLNFMEEAHSMLASLVRNFVVKYADDQRFDYQAYKPIEGNPDKHPFFTLLFRKNDRMQHLALLTRFLRIEQANKIVDIKNSDVVQFIKDTETNDGIGNFSLENEPYAKRTLQNLNLFYAIFKNDPMVQDGSPLRELSVEYFIISVYLLLRHLRAYYVFGQEERELFRKFVISYHQRWKAAKQTDNDILLFTTNRQQSTAETEARDRLLRQAFFQFAAEHEHNMLTKDERRAFSEAERIAIYRRNDGLCQVCLAEGKPEKEARVPWSEFDADHVIPHAKGGRTDIENAQVLCRYHNQHKGATMPTDTIVRTPEATTPTHFVLLGQSYEFRTWNGMLITACSTLAKRHGDEFAAKAFTVRGDTRQYVASVPTGMTHPARIPDTDLWVEANQSAESAKRLVEKLLAALGHDAAEPGVFEIAI